MCLRIAFTNNERQDEDMDVRSCKTSPVMQAMHHLVVLKCELPQIVLKRM